MTNERSHPESLEDFVAGRKNDEENAHILEHLADCEQCAAEVEALWAKSPASHILPETSEAPPEAMTALEESLFRRIHRSDLGGQVIRLGTQGFINLIAALLSPLANRRRPSKQGGLPNDRS